MKALLSALAALVWLAGDALAAGEDYVISGKPRVVVAIPGAKAEWVSAKRQPEHRAYAQPLFATLSYLGEALKRMTGTEPEFSFDGATGEGIVLMLLESAPSEIRNDERVRKALHTTPEDAYNGNEAYFVRSAKERVLIVANRVEGLSHGVVALLESVGYEVLGMGPNWTHVPDYRGKPLVFRMEEEGRPGFYIRYLWPTSGQERGVGTLSRVVLNDPMDEVVEKSYSRWTVGTRQAGTSMPRIRGGHALGRYHREVVAAMREQGKTEGFLFEKVFIGADAERPAAAAENQGALWINADPGPVRCFLSDGTRWVERDLKHQTAGACLDLSSELTRQVILKAMIEKAEAAFAARPDEPFQFTTDPEDGASQFARIASLVNNPNWYPEYLQRERIHFGAYKLHGFKGLNQPTELWDPHSPSDHVYGFNNWLLREFDKYVDGLPEAERVTASGHSKKALVRCNLLSYNYHDVPPNFNLDPRIRIKIAGFPKHRGKGKWLHLRTHADLAAAYRILLPEASVDYRIWSQAYFHDYTVNGIGGSPRADAIQRFFREEYEAGFRGFEAETDFNFGKYGLWYYLSAKMLWNPHLTAGELEALRDRWFQRAFGSAWREMKEYYDFMAPESSRPNSPNTWAKAIRYLEAADRRLKTTNEEAARRRLDDLKQYWYFYYLVESGLATRDSEALRTFVWKGQMAYTIPMVMVTKRFFQRAKAEAVAGPELAAGPAHYRSEEVAEWWQKVLDFWPVTPLEEFADAALADGTRGSEVDLNDLVPVQEFQAKEEAANNLIIYNRDPGRLLRKEHARFLTVALKPDQVIGFKLFWPAVSKGGRRNSAIQVPYGIKHWNARERTWEELVDITTTMEQAVPFTMPDGEPGYVLEVRYVASQPGTYSIEVGSAVFETHLTSLDYDPANGKAQGSAGHVYMAPTEVSKLTDRQWFIYIPKGTRQLDFETTSDARIALVLYRGVPGKEWRRSRKVNLAAWGPQSVELQPGEDGSVAVVECWALPSFTSIPRIYAKTPSALLVPRKIAIADGLTPVDQPGEGER